MGGDKRGEGNGRDGKGRDGKIGNDGEGRDEREGKERDGKVTYPHSRVELLIVAWIRPASAAASVRLHVAAYNSNSSAAFDHSSRSCRLGGLEIGACSVSKQFRPRLHRDCTLLEANETSVWLAGANKEDMLCFDFRLDRLDYVSRTEVCLPI